KRARPILMTSLAMGAGMLPIALGFGADSAFRAPMAIVVMGGLITSTVLSLLVIPVLYAVLDDLVRCLVPASWRGAGRGLPAGQSSSRVRTSSTRKSSSARAEGNWPRREG